MGGITHWWRRPILRNDFCKLADLDKPRHELWLELFFDLFFVALLLKMGDILYYCKPISFNILSLFIIFFVVWVTRFQLDNYVNRFYTEDLSHKIMFFIQFMGVFCMILNVNETSDSYNGDYSCTWVHEYSIGFAVGFIITRLSLTIMYLVAMYFHAPAFYQFQPLLISHLISLTLAIIVTSLPSSSDEAIIYFWTAISFVEAVGLIWPNFRLRIPIHVDELRTRLGTFVMIVLGESIIQLLIQTLDVSKINKHYCFGFFGLLMTFNLALQYFDASPHDVKHHAMRQSRNRGLVWVWIHPFLYYCLFCVGASIKMLLFDLLEDNHDDEDIRKHSGILSLSAFIAICMINIVRMLHKGLSLNIIKARPRRTFAYAMRFLIAIAHALVYPLSSPDPVIIMISHAVISCFAVIVDIIAHGRKRVVAANLGIDPHAEHGHDDEDTDDHHKKTPAVAMINPIKPEHATSTSDTNSTTSASSTENGRVVSVKFKEDTLSKRKSVNAIRKETDRDEYSYIRASTVQRNIDDLAADVSDEEDEEDELRTEEENQTTGVPPATTS